MKVLKTIFDRVLVCEFPLYADERGTFSKFFHPVDFLENYNIKQTNYVQNPLKGVIRGLHFQEAPHQEAKLFRIIKGAVRLVFCDIDQGSLTFKSSETLILDELSIGIYIPKGFATGYEVLQNRSEVLYFSDVKYLPEEENGIRWNHPLLAHHWTHKNPIVSDKDRNWKTWES